MNKRMYGSYTTETLVDNGQLYRRCIFCGEVKLLSQNFARNGVDADGGPAYRQDCKTCYNIRRHENRNKKAHSDFLGGQRRRGDTPSFTLQEWKEVLIYFGGECAYCGCTPRRGQRLTRDHLKALSREGSTCPSNIVPACPTCNCSKGAEDFKDWYMRQPFFSQERLNKIFKWRTIMNQVGGTQNE